MAAVLVSPAPLRQVLQYFHKNKVDLEVTSLVKYNTCKYDVLLGHGLKLISDEACDFFFNVYLY